MSNYLPVLLVSVSAGMPDDASFQPLPRGQVDYLSHDWQEEDVWRSWRNMTKQKNEISNGVRLENASWRTWWKQRNKLKTISPETLNWLKDSDVTWLYGPLHTAVDWTPPPKPQTPTPPKKASSNAGDSPKATHTIITSPSSGVALDIIPTAHGYEIQNPTPGMKPILKHRSISEMLTKALPPSPLFSNDDTPMREDDEDEENQAGRVVFSYGSFGADGKPFLGPNGRPPMYHTKSDTSILHRFGKREATPRVAAANVSQDSGTLSESSERSLLSASRPPSSNAQPSPRLTHSKRSSSSGNLVDLPSASTSFATNVAGFPWHAYPKRTMDSPVGTTSSSPSSTSWGGDVESGRTETSSQRSLSGQGSGSGSTLKRQDHQAAAQPQKKHISFNAIVQQCISIEGSPDPVTPSNKLRAGKAWAHTGATLHDDGYDEDEEDGPGDDTRSSSDSEDVFDEDEDGVLEIRTPSRRSSNSSSDGTYRESVRSQTPYSTQVNPHAEEHTQEWVQRQQSQNAELDGSRRPFRERSPNENARAARGRGNAKFARSSRSKSGSTSASSSSRSRSTQTSDREHVTIAPIAPTILKAGGSTSSEDNALYPGYRSYGTYGVGGVGGGGGRWRSGTAGDGRVYDAFDAVELGAEPTEYGLHHSLLSAYPWVDHHHDARIVDFDDLNHFHDAGFADEEEDVGGVAVGVVGGDVDGDDGSGTYRRSIVLARGGRHSTGIMPYRGKGGGVLESVDRQLSPPRQVSPVHSGVISEPKVVEAQSLVVDDREDVVSPVSNRDQSPPLLNPRVNTLRSEVSYRPVGSRSPEADQPPILVQPTPTVAIPTPAISPAHIREHASRYSTASPTRVSGYLSPQDASPSRGRSPCPSPVSSYVTTGSTTSSSGLFSLDSRSVSESRSDSRGRSRTRGSSVSTSDQEPERGRSRSRSTGASGANSPLSDSNSPSNRRAAGTASIGVRYGHSGREIRDGRGVGIYRKTSEDNLQRGGGMRGRDRERDNRRISESLSPPAPGYHSEDNNNHRHRHSPPGNAYRLSPNPSSYDSQQTQLQGHSPRMRQHLSSSPDVDGVARLIPPSIPEEEDEQRVVGGVGESSLSSDEDTHQKDVVSSLTTEEPGVDKPELGSPPAMTMGDSTPRLLDTSTSNDHLSSTLVGRAAGIVSSARGLLGSIWNTGS